MEIGGSFSEGVDSRDLVFLSPRAETSIILATSNAILCVAIFGFSRTVGVDLTGKMPPESRYPLRSMESGFVWH